MGIVSVAAIMIFGILGLGIVVTIAFVLASALQSDSDRRRLIKMRREQRKRGSPK